jgi:hypothetical protein
MVLGMQTCSRERLYFFRRGHRRHRKKSLRSSIFAKRPATGHEASWPMACSCFPEPGTFRIEPKRQHGVMPMILQSSCRSIKLSRKTIEFVYDSDSCRINRRNIRAITNFHYLSQKFSTYFFPRRLVFCFWQFFLGTNISAARRHLATDKIIIFLSMKDVLVA